MKLQETTFLSIFYKVPRHEHPDSRLRWVWWSVRPCQGQEHGKTLRLPALRGWPQLDSEGLTHPQDPLEEFFWYYMPVTEGPRGTNEDRLKAAAASCPPRGGKRTWGYCREGQAPRALVSRKFHLSIRHLFENDVNDKLLKDKPPPINGLLSSPLLELIIIWWLAHSSLKSSSTETNFTSMETLPPAASFSGRDSQYHWESTHLSLRRPCRPTPEDYSRVVSLLTHKDRPFNTWQLCPGREHERLTWRGAADGAEPKVLLS